MKSYRLTPAAEDDLFEIWVFIAEDNLPAADGLELQACDRLAVRPDLGHLRRDLTDKPVRFFAVRGTYLIVYDPATQPLEVLRSVAHLARSKGCPNGTTIHWRPLTARLIPGVCGTAKRSVPHIRTSLMSLATVSYRCL